MKKILILLGTVTLTFLALAEEAKKAPAPVAGVKEAPAATVIPVTAAVISAPFVLKDGAISQPEQTEVAAGGKAVFTFSVPKAGDYVIHGVASAPDEDSNSFFLNIDAAPEDPLMIWDIEVNQGFTENVVGWRGNGDAASPEFAPKVFKLTAGEHKLNIVGREPTVKLKSVTIRPAN